MSKDRIAAQGLVQPQQRTIDSDSQQPSAPLVENRSFHVTALPEPETAGTDRHSKQTFILLSTGLLRYCSRMTSILFVIRSLGFQHPISFGPTNTDALCFQLECGNGRA